MSHLVTYIIDIPGAEFNQLLAPSFKANPDELREIIETGSLWDGRLPGAEIDFSVELSGLVTIVWLTVRYSTFVYDPDENSKVVLWERCLFNILKGKPAIRADELLVLGFEDDRDEFWFRRAEAFEVFRNWVASQGGESWYSCRIRNT